MLRALGTRYGIGVGLLVAVVLVVVVARVLPHTDAPPILSNGAAAAQSAPVVAVAPSVASPSPTVPLLHSPVPPRVRAGARPPQQVARAFATAWLHTAGVSAAAWLRGVSAYSTAALAGQLAETDPANVPAQRMTSAPSLVNDTANSCLVKVPMDTGTLALTMTAVDGKWLVGGVDWDRGSA